MKRGKRYTGPVIVDSMSGGVYALSDGHEVTKHGYRKRRQIVIDRWPYISLGPTNFK